MKFRTYTEADAESLAAVFTSSVHSLAITQYDAKQREAWAPDPPNVDEWRQRFSGLQTLIVEDEGSFLGFISYEANGHIDLLYTAPDAARRGVASALLRQAVLQLSTEGAATELFTEASLVAAPFFLRHGFEITEEQHVVRRGISFRRFAMRRHIDADEKKS